MVDSIQLAVEEAVKETVGRSSRLGKERRTSQENDVVSAADKRGEEGEEDRGWIGEGGAASCPQLST